MSRGVIAVCDECGKEKPYVRKNQITGKNTCQLCYDSSRKEKTVGICCQCGRKKPLRHKNKEGCLICSGCDSKKQLSRHKQTQTVFNLRFYKTY